MCTPVRLPDVFMAGTMVTGSIDLNVLVFLGQHSKGSASIEMAVVDYEQSWPTGCRRVGIESQEYRIWCPMSNMNNEHRRVDSAEPEPRDKNYV